MFYYDGGFNLLLRSVYLHTFCVLFSSYFGFIEVKFFSIVKKIIFEKLRYFDKKEEKIISHLNSTGKKTIKSTFSN